MPRVALLGVVYLPLGRRSPRSAANIESSRMMSMCLLSIEVAPSLHS